MVRNPHATDEGIRLAGSAVLGLLLRDPRLLGEDVASLDASIFRESDLILIYEATVRLVQRGIQPDPVSVSDELSRRDLLSDVGGPAAVERLLDVGAAPTNFRHHLRSLVSNSAPEVLGKRLLAAKGDLGRIRHAVEDVSTLLTFVDSGCSATDRFVEDMESAVSVLDPRGCPAVEPAILHPFFGKGDLGILAGPAGCGKTTAALNILLSFVVPQMEGASLDGVFRVGEVFSARARVALVDAENPKDRCGSMVRGQLESRGIPIDAAGDRLLHVDARDLIGRHGASATDRAIALARLLARREVEFFVGDSIARIFDPEDVRSEGWVQRCLVPFRHECQRLGISGLFLAHTARPGEKASGPQGPFGSVFQDAQTDVVLMARSLDAKGSGIRIEHKKSRRPRRIRGNTAVEWKFTGDGGYSVRSDWGHEWPHDQTAAPATESTAQKILDVIADAGSAGLSSTSIAELVELSDGTVRKHLRRLADSRKVEKQGAGRATVWRLRTDGRSS